MGSQNGSNDTTHTPPCHFTIPLIMKNHSHYARIYKRLRSPGPMPPAYVAWQLESIPGLLKHLQIRAPDSTGGRHYRFKEVPVKGST